jgi:uncharacterized zinc-type alcohol dehydrogenase-like protein
MNTIGYAADGAGAPLKPYAFQRRKLRPDDVAIEILYCGVCHSDLHQVRNDWSEWGPTVYPVVPGHEIVGRVTAVGDAVKRYKVGDPVAVGCMVDSCQVCDQCRKGEEQFCREGLTATYNGRDRITQEVTRGGYAKHLVVRKNSSSQFPKAWTSRARRPCCARESPPTRRFATGPSVRAAGSA